MKKIVTLLSILSAGFLFFILVFTSDSTVPVLAVQESNNQGDIHGSEINEDEHPTLDHQEIVRLTDEFMNILVQETINEKVIHINTIEELLQEFDRVVASEEVVMPYIEFYYTEEDDGLYLLPTETPPWFVPENEYELNQLSDNQLVIIQENTIELYGDYIIEIEFLYEDGWKISKITHR